MTVDFADRLRDLDCPLDRDFLLDQRHRKQRFEILWSDRFQRARMQDGLGRTRQVGDDVVPILGQPGFIERIFYRIGHRLLLVRSGHPLAGAFQIPRSCISRI